MDILVARFRSGRQGCLYGCEEEELHPSYRQEANRYTSTQLAAVATDLDVRLSVGRTGVCWDNAQQESFWSTLKTDHYDRYTFTTRAGAIRSVSGWIENTYNRHRRHSALGQISPITFEYRLTTAATQAA